MVTIRQADIGKDNGTLGSGAATIHYHVLLTSLLQRRFARATFLVFLASYTCAYIIGQGSCKRVVLRANSGIHLLFPWSRTLPRALVLFLGLFAILISHKAQMRGELWVC
jgi:hypothetical protein